MKDIDNLQKIFSDPITMQYYPRVLNKAQTILWIQKVLDSYGKWGIGLWACHLKETDEFVGQCGLVVQENIAGQEEIEVGYLFIREFWNRGLATEAARGCINYGYQNLALPRIISLIRPDNQASLRVAKKNGLSFWKKIHFNGKLHHIYAISFPPS